MTGASRPHRARSGLLQAGRAWGLICLALTLLLPSGARASDQGDGHDDGHSHHRHHVAVVGGAAFKDSKTAGFLGADYVFSPSPSFGLGAAYEETLETSSSRPSSFLPAIGPVEVR